MQLDFTSLKKAIHSLELAVNEYKINTNDFIRDSCIQRFEYTYELSCKMLKRHLELTMANPSEADALSFQELIRRANEKGLLLNDWETWKLYRIYRGTTSHAYDQQKANEIYKEIPKFLEEAIFLLKQLDGKS